MTRRSRVSLTKRELVKDKDSNPGMDAAVYFGTRDMNPSKTSTLIKAMRARRIENGKRPLSLKDEVLTKRELRRVEKGKDPTPPDHALIHAGRGGALAVHEALMPRFKKINHRKTLA